MTDGVAGDAETRAIKYLRVTAREAPEQAERMLELSWVQDGITADEAMAIEYLRWAAKNAPTLSNRMLNFPWVKDGITATEARITPTLSWLMHDAPALAKQMLELSWVQDDITETEATALEYLRWINGRNADAAAALLELSWVQDDITETEATALKYLYGMGGRNADAAAALVAMPFLEFLESRDMLALQSLNDIAARDAGDFKELMSHPRIKDGITDEETKIVAVLGARTYSRAPGSAKVLLAETGVYVEERLIELPLTGETLLAVIRTEDRVTPRMDHFEHAVRSIERFMGLPFPIDYLALLYYDYSGPANNNFTHLFLNAEYDTVEGRPFHASVIAHEAAHWYWRRVNDGDYQYQTWISEGNADFLRIISEHERIGRRLEPIKSQCRHFDNISELEEANPDSYLPSGERNPAQICHYSLGQRLFLDLYLALGDETFRPAYRTLYLKTQQDDPTDNCESTALNICHVVAAFKDGASAEVVRKVDEVIARWYGPLP